MRMREVRAVILTALLGVMMVTAAHDADGDPLTTNDWIIGIYAGSKARHLDSSATFIQDTPNDFNSIVGIDTGPDGNVYICSQGNNQIRQYDKTDFQVYAVVATPTTPQAVAFGPGGDMYVLEANGAFDPHRIRRYAGPLAASPFSDLGIFTGTTPSGLIGFQDIEFGPDGNIYVSNWKTTSSSPDPSIERFDGITGNYIDSFVPASDTNLVNIRGLTVGPNGDIYVANMPVSSSTSGEVVRFQGPNGANPGTFVERFVTVSGNAGLDLPQILRFGSDSNLYVTGFLNDKLQRYQGPNGASPGTFIDNFAGFSGGSQPLGLTQVKTNPLPRSIQVGDWFFGTYYSETIRRHDSDGQFVGNAGGDSFLGMDIGPDTNLYACRSEVIYSYSSSNFADSVVISNVFEPQTLKFGPNGNLYVMESGSLNPNRIRKFTGPHDGSPFTDLGIFATGLVDQTGFQDMEFGPDGNLYVSNWKTPSTSPFPSIERFNGISGAPMGTYIATSEPNLDNVTGIAFGPDGNLYVGNKSANGEILRYQGPDGGSPGTFIDIFTPTDNGLGLAQDIHFGDDGNIYTCNWFSNTVTRFQGPNGASPGTFIDNFARLPFNSTGATVPGEHGYLYMTQFSGGPGPPPQPKPPMGLYFSVQ